MADVGLTRKSARELARLIRAGAVSPVEVLDAHLAVIEAVNPKLNAIVTLAAEQARADARLAEIAVGKGEPLGPLHGLPVAIKDITPTAGIRTTFASPLYEDYVPTDDAEVVRRLKAAGAIVLAKTNTPEFACGAYTDNALFGPTRNPWNPMLSPAGSSGGSAVAVATGMVPIAQATDFGGSIRIPAGLLRHRRPSSDAGPCSQSPDAADLGSRASPWRPGARRRGCRLHARCYGRLQPPVADLGHAAMDGARLPKWNAAPTPQNCALPTRLTSPVSASTPKSRASAAKRRSGFAISRRNRRRDRF